MNRRHFINSMLSGIATAHSGALGGQQEPLAAAAPRPQYDPRPNFVFIIADDHTFRAVHALTNREVYTPNIDRLAASGCHFSHCFHQGSWLGAVCVASRTMLNSGLSAFRARNAWIASSTGHPDGLDSVKTWAETFRSAGYDTYLAGKWHLDATLLHRGFKQTGPVGPGMFPSTEVGGEAYYRPRPGNTWQPWDETLKGHWLHTSKWEHAERDSIIHSDVLYGDHVVEYLQERAQTAAPFFLYMGFNSPHDPRQSPSDYLARYPQDKIQIPPNFMPEFPFDEGEHKLRDEILAPFPRTHEAVQLHRREYYSLITYMDEQIGRVLDALAASGRAGNTYIIYTADHGLSVGEHGLLGKQNMFEASVRIPLIVAGPNVPKGRTVDDLVYQHSMFPMTCKLAGIQPPAQVEFPDISAMLSGPVKPVHDAMFCYYKGFQRMVRTREHKLIVYPYAKRTQLFDVQKDPWEIHDLAGSAQTRALQTSLMNRLRQFQKELGDDLNLENPGPVQEVPKAIIEG